MKILHYFSIVSLRLGLTPHVRGNAIEEWQSNPDGESERETASGQSIASRRQAQADMPTLAVKEFPTRGPTPPNNPPHTRAHPVPRPVITSRPTITFNWFPTSFPTAGNATKPVKGPRRKPVRAPNRVPVREPHKGPPNRAPVKAPEPVSVPVKASAPLPAAPEPTSAAPEPVTTLDAGAVPAPANPAATPNARTPTVTFPPVLPILPNCFDNTTLVFKLVLRLHDTSVVNTFRLCPNTTYDIGYFETDEAGVTTLTKGKMAPLVGRTNVQYICGVDGSVHNKCILRGGDTQFFNSYELFEEPVFNCTVRGFTFDQADNIGAALLNEGDTTFENCIFQNHANVGAMLLSWDPTSVNFRDETTRARRLSLRTKPKVQPVLQRMGAIMKKMGRQGEIVISSKDRSLTGGHFVDALQEALHAGADAADNAGFLQDNESASEATIGPGPIRAPIRRPHRPPAQNPVPEPSSGHAPVLKPTRVAPSYSRVPSAPVATAPGPGGPIATTMPSGKPWPRQKISLVNTIFKDNRQGLPLESTSRGVITATSGYNDIEIRWSMFSNNTFSSDALGYAILASSGSSVNISYTNFIDNNFAGLGVVNVLGGGEYSVYMNYGTANGDLQCEFLAFSSGSTDSISCIDYDLDLPVTMAPTVSPTHAKPKEGRDPA